MAYGFYISAEGAQAQSRRMEVLAHNLANVDTVGFKRVLGVVQARHSEAIQQGSDYPGSQSLNDIGGGVYLSETSSQFSPGAIKHTGIPTDLAIDGEGFFQVKEDDRTYLTRAGNFELTNEGQLVTRNGQAVLATDGQPIQIFQVLDPNGETLYTRAGNFSINNRGQLVMGSASTGRLVQPSISIPEDTTHISINPDGAVFVKQPGTETLSEVGQITLSTFINPEGLLKLGENLYSETDASGSATSGNPNQNGIGSLRQNFLEASNVEPVQELIDLIQTQRAFELNSQMVQAGDQMLQLVANLRRL